MSWSITAMIESISAITLATHDMARAVRFYRMLGLKFPPAHSRTKGRVRLPANSIPTKWTVQDLDRSGKAIASTTAAFGLSARPGEGDLHIVLHMIRSWPGEQEGWNIEGVLIDRIAWKGMPVPARMGAG
jgi:hypothetical protein